MHIMVDPLQDMTVVDYGNAPNDMMSTECTIHAVRSFVRQAAEVQHADGSLVIPFIIGGDHSLMYPDVAALTDVCGKGNVGVVHFDAHYDAGKYGFGHLINHGMPVYRLIEEDLVEGWNFIQVALRGYYPDEKAFEWMRENGFRYHTMAEIERRGFDAVSFGYSWKRSLYRRAVRPALVKPNLVIVSAILPPLWLSDCRYRLRAWRRRSSAYRVGLMPIWFSNTL